MDTTHLSSSLRHLATLLAAVPLLGDLAAQSVATFPSDHATIADGQFSTPSFPDAYGVSRVMAVY